MRDTIDFGIDLGTTNSAIAVVTNGTPSVIKNNEGMDFTPSAVWMPRPGQIRVGRAARDRSGSDPKNAHGEFKQEMGLDEAGRTFQRAAATLSPPELSAEVLRSLRNDAAAQYGEPPSAAVITVPAAFRLHQNNATSEAATLAGFTSPCPLIQEPTAAAFAFGFQDTSDDAYWMVFDFGGGTFDSAVISTRDGELRVLDHAGDPHLGGKLIDWAILERLLIPAVVREYGFEGFTRGNPEWDSSMASLKLAAEEAKIALSRMDRCVLDADLFRGTDEVGSLEYTLTRAELDRVAEPYYVRAVNLCRDALAKANLHPDDIDRLLLVGGATLAPGLREMLADPKAGLGIELDFSQDPSTVVARGAAVYAGTVPLERTFVAPSAGQIGVELDYPRTTSLTSVVVGGRFHSGDPVDWSGYRVMLDNPTGQPPYRTPRIALADDGTFAAEVRLNEQVDNTFRIELADALGAPSTVDPNSISIRHWVNEPAGPVLTNTIGIHQVDGTTSRVLEKGTTLPASCTKPFHTTADLRRGDPNGVIRIHVLEGERHRVARNLRVATIEIRSADIPLDLPKGTDVDITIQIDTSRLVTAIAEVPLINEQFDAVFDLDHVPIPDIETLRYDLSEAETRLDRLRAKARTAGSARAAELLGKLDAEHALEAARDEVRAAAQDPGSAAAADARIRDIMAVLDEVEEETELPGRLDQADDTLDDCQELAGRLGDASDRTELAGLRRRLEAARRDRDADAAEDLNERAAELYMSLLRRDGYAFDVELFYALRHLQPRLTSPARGRELVAEGERAIAGQRWPELRGVNEKLRRLLPDEYEVGEGGVIRRDGGV